jgi:hypothetical protein
MSMGLMKAVRSDTRSLGLCSALRERVHPAAAILQLRETKARITIWDRQRRGEASTLSGRTQLYCCWRAILRCLESFVLVLYNGNDRDERDSRNDQKMPDPQSLCSDLSHPRNYRKQVRRC